MTKSLLPAKNSAQNYGFFGYSGAMCDMAIRADNVEMLKECMANGWIDADTEVMCYPNVLDFCERRGFVKCAELLRSTKVTS